MKAVKIGIYLTACLFLIGIEIPDDAPIELAVSYYGFVLVNMGIAVMLANRFIK